MVKLPSTDRYVYIGNIREIADGFRHRAPQIHAQICQSVSDLAGLQTRLQFGKATEQDIEESRMHYAMLNGYTEQVPQESQVAYLRQVHNLGLALIEHYKVTDIGAYMNPVPLGEIRFRDPPVAIPAGRAIERAHLQDPVEHIASVRSAINPFVNSHPELYGTISAALDDLAEFQNRMRGKTEATKEERIYMTLRFNTLIAVITEVPLQHKADYGDGLNRLGASLANRYGWLKPVPAAASAGNGPAAHAEADLSWTEEDASRKAKRAPRGIE